MSAPTHNTTDILIALNLWIAALNPQASKKRAIRRFSLRTDLNRLKLPPDLHLLIAPSFEEWDRLPDRGKEAWRLLVEIRDSLAKGLPPGHSTVVPISANICGGNASETKRD